jgi:hypothetical protein
MQESAYMSYDYSAIPKYMAALLMYMHQYMGSMSGVALAGISPL